MRMMTMTTGTMTTTMTMMMTMTTGTMTTTMTMMMTMTTIGGVDGGVIER